MDETTKQLVSENTNENVTPTAEYTSDPHDFKLTHHAYCGMNVPLIERDEHADRADCRKRAAHILRRRRKQGYIVSVLERGQEWEITDPDDAVMVSDHAGVMTLAAIPVPTYRCWQCGFDVPKGETCSCFEPFEDDEPEPDDEPDDGFDAEAEAEAKNGTA